MNLRLATSVFKCIEKCLAFSWGSRPEIGVTVDLCWIDLDCSQSPIFPWDRRCCMIVESDGPPSWSLDASETGESTKFPWVVAVGLKAWGWRGGINRETVTASLYLVFAALVAPATATPDWSKGQKSSSEQIRALTTWVTESYIH